MTQIQAPGVNGSSQKFIIRLLPVCLFAVTVAVFLPALKNGFVNWDDDWMLLENTAYRGLDLTHLRWMFTTFHAGHYQPLSWLTLAIDYHFWGMNPLGYHLTNLILHGANAVCFFFVARKLLRCALPEAFPYHWPALVAALLFALHPL